VAARSKDGRLRMNLRLRVVMMQHARDSRDERMEINMRRRYQRGSLKSVNGKWLFQYYDLQGKKRKARFGGVREITKSEAQLKADAIMGPINMAARTLSDVAFDQFVELQFFPWYRRKWKNSTRGTTE